jgi:hypothetical protein
VSLRPADSGSPSQGPSHALARQIENGEREKRERKIEYYKNNKSGEKLRKKSKQRNH